MVLTQASHKRLQGIYSQITLFIFLTKTCIMELTDLLVIGNRNVMVVNYFSLLGKNKMKEWSLTIITGCLVVNDKLK